MPKPATLGSEDLLGYGLRQAKPLTFSPGLSSRRGHLPPAVRRRGSTGVCTTPAFRALLAHSTPGYRRLLACGLGSEARQLVSRLWRVGARLASASACELAASVGS
jgi:hypothetical protein